MNTKAKFIFLAIVFLLSVFLNLRMGSVWIENQTFWQILTRNLQGSTEYLLLWQYRLPKLLVAIGVGAGLGLAGLLMQTLFRNPIVGPYVLGLSGGSGLAVALLMLGGSWLGWHMDSPGWIVLAAGLGSIIVLWIDIMLFKILKSTASLLIAGLMIGAFSGALLSVLVYFSQAEQLQHYTFWTMGRLGNTTSGERFIFLFIVVSGYLTAIFLIRYLNQLLVGESYARSMGISLEKISLYIIILTGILTGAVTAIAGPVAFVGLVVPHLARMFFNTQMHRILLPAVFLMGSILMIWTDMISQLPGSDWILPVNSITALIGAPLVIRLLIKGIR